MVQAIFTGKSSCHSETYIAFNLNLHLMGLPRFVLEQILLAVLVGVLLNTLVTAQEGPLGNQAEKDALDGLKATLNDPFLNSNWIGYPCNVTEPSRWFGVRCSNGRVTSIVLEGRGLAGRIDVRAFFNLGELSILSFKNNSLKGSVMDFSNNHQMKYIDLSGNEFAGPISKSLLSLNLLETLLLQDNNKLTDPMPEFNQPSLKMINVSNNDLQGRIPETHTLQSLGPDSFSGNPQLCGPPSPNSCSFSSFSSLTSTLPAPADDQGINNAQPQSPNESSDKKQTPTILLIFNVALLFAIILLGYLYFNTAKKLNKMMKRQQLHIDKNVVETVDKNVEMGNHQVQEPVMAVEERKELVFFKDEPKFQINELLKASAEALGQGIMGNSYKAMLHGGPSIVVKRLRDLKPMTREEFAKQLNLIADLKHPNLLPLLAYYHTKNERLLLYRYAEKGNIFYRLHGIYFTHNLLLNFINH